MGSYKKIFKECLSDLLIFLGIGALVQIVWCGLELLFLGHTNPSTIDTIIGLILIYSLHSNYKHWNAKKE